MVQRGNADRLPKFRDRHRAERRREFLEIARHIIETESQEALTMLRVTEAAGTSSGGIYVYFPTKDSLLDELGREAFEILLVSYREGQAHLQKFLDAANASASDAALTRVLANCMFWVESEATLPIEVELSRRLIGGQTLADMTNDAEVLPLALNHLHEGRDRLDACVDAGILDPGDNLQRAVLLISSVTGVLLVSNLGSWDPELFDGRALALSLAEDVLAGWGASRDHLAVAEVRLASFQKQGQLAPPAEPRH